MGYCTNPNPKIFYEKGPEDYIEYSIQFNSYTYQSFNWIYDIWYQNDIKKVPINIQEYLTPITIAIWIINDGYRSGKTLKWINYNLSYEDCNKITNAIFNLYNIKCNVIPIGKTNKYTISVQENSIILICNLVKNYIVSDIQYKIILD